MTRVREQDLTCSREDRLCSLSCAFGTTGEDLRWEEVPLLSAPPAHGALQKHSVFFQPEMQESQPCWSFPFVSPLLAAKNGAEFVIGSVYSAQPSSGFGRGYEEGHGMSNSDRAGC